MQMLRFQIVLCYVLLWGLMPAAWQEAAAQPVKGVVWDPPVNNLRAREDLFEMKANGVEAIRTPLLLRNELYEIADSLELQLYQDFPFEYLSTGELLDTLEYAKEIALEAVRWAARYPVIRHFGLGRNNDTSDPRACRFFEEIIQTIRQNSRQPVDFYYLTSFVEDEQCANAFDVVLLSALDESDPQALLRRWYTTHPDTPAGIGALGVWVKEYEDDRDGFRLQNSEAYQARYLENHLNTLLSEEIADSLASVFVYRWEDSRLRFPSVSHNLEYPYRHSYGLKTNRNVERVSYHVLKGIYTGRQKVFAFPVGQAESPGASWTVILGWITITLLGVGYAYFPRFRPNVKRYFGAHGFYRSAVEEGRELLFGPTALLLGAVMLAFGIAGAVLLDTVRVTDAFAALVRWMPDTSRTTLVALMANQFVLILMIACGFAVAVTLWTSILSAATARNRRRLLPGQTFMLVVWPQWPIILTMIVAMVISTLEPAQASFWLLTLFIVLIASILISTARAFHDYASITRPSFLQASIALIGNPLVLLLLIAFYFSILHAEKFRFFWHLLTRA